MSSSPDRSAAPRKRRFTIEPLEERIAPTCGCMMHPQCPCHHPTGFLSQSQFQSQFQSQAQSQSLSLSISISGPMHIVRSGFGVM
jgi:hypothetical protein